MTVVFANIRNVCKLEMTELGEDPITMVNSLVIKPLTLALEDSEAIKD